MCGACSTTSKKPAAYTALRITTHDGEIVGDGLLDEQRNVVPCIQKSKGKSGSWREMIGAYYNIPYSTDELRNPRLAWI